MPEAQKIRGESDITEYSPLRVGKYYSVCAIKTTSYRIEFLIEPEMKKPGWYPACLFAIIDNEIPPNFHMAIIEYGSDFDWLKRDWGVQSIIGYKRIIESSDHYNGVLDRRPEDIELFEAEGHQSIESNFS